MDQFFDWGPFRWRADINQWKSTGVGSYWVTLPLQLMIFILLFLGLDFIGVFICSNTDLFVEICLDELKGFPAGLKKDVVELCHWHSCAHIFEQSTCIDQSHIDHQGDCFRIYCE